MARIYEPTTEQIKIHADWLAEKPAHIKAVAERFFPWELYRFKASGMRVVIISFAEALFFDIGHRVTITCAVLARYNFVPFEHKILGVLPEDLEPCELPGPEEKLGASYSTHEEIEAYVKKVQQHLDAPSPSRRQH